MVGRSIDHAEALAHVGETDAARHRLLETLEQEPHTVVFNLNHDARLVAPAANHDCASTHFPREAMLNRVFDQRLEDHAWHHEIERVRRKILAHAQLWPETHHLDVEIFVDGFDFLPQRDEVLLAAKQPPQQCGELVDQRARRFRFRPDERRDRCQRVEQKVWIDLTLERFNLRRKQQLLLLLQAVFDARAVPDLDWSHNSQHGGEDDEQHHRRCWRAKLGARVEETLWAEARAERLPQQFKRDGRQQQPDLPAEPELSHHPPDMLREIDENERREFPDGFLRTALAKTAAGETATDCKWKRDDFSGDRGRDANEDAHKRTGVGSGDEAREQGTFER